VEGRTLADLFSGTPVDVAAMVARLKHVAAELGLPFGARSMTYNSRLAQELGKWAESRGSGEAFHQEVFRAYFVEGQNIAQSDVLQGVVRRVGLPQREASEVIENRSFRHEVDRDWMKARRMGVSAVPTLMAGGKTLVGAQPYSEMEQFLIQRGIRKRSPAR
jgi:predicted DsbA family dithiol-disulfide isomerase